MRDVAMRRVGIAVIAVALFAGVLRLWAAIAYPPLDAFDRSPLLPVLGCALIVAAIAATTVPDQWQVPPHGRRARLLRPGRVGR
jgi:hypothetical protein